VEGIVGLIIEIVAGVIGGNAAGSAAKKYGLGTAGNSIAGGIGGLVLGQILAALGMGEPTMGAEGAAAPAGAGLDIGALLAQVVGGGVGGAALTLIGGLIKGMMQK
jgi:hypothetical protein